MRGMNLVLGFHPVGRVFAGILAMLLVSLTVGSAGGAIPKITLNTASGLVIAALLASGALGFGLLAVGALKISFDTDGILYRNLLFRRRYLPWESVRTVRIHDEPVRNEEWMIIGTRTYLEIAGDSMKLDISPDFTGPPNWWHTLLTLAKNKAPQAHLIGFSGTIPG